jgi:hypothetical protein
MQTSPISAPAHRAEHAAWRREPVVLAEVLAAVSAVNEQLLEALVESSRVEGAEFPLPESLRDRVARLTLEERQRTARCGVFLADANFVDFSCWREMALGAQAARSELLRPWLPIEASRSLAHCALLIAWHLTHASPAVACVLLGMSAPGVAAFRELGVAELAHVARHHSHWVRPRWSYRLDIWSDLIGVPVGDSRSMTLRCLQVSTGDLKWLSAYVDRST